MLKEFFGIIHMSIETLKRWDNSGVLTAYRNQKNK